MKSITSKTVIFCIICMIFGSNIVFPQDDKVKKTPEEKAVKITERMKAKLNLDDTQSQKVHDLYLSHFTDMKALRESTQTTDKTAIKEKMKSGRKEIKTGLKNILTDEQFKKLKHNMHHRHHKRHR